MIEYIDRRDGDTHEQIVGKYDRRAHRKKAAISITLTGGFRGADHPLSSHAGVLVRLDADKSYTEGVDEAIRLLEELKVEAYKLDVRIEQRKRQPMSERTYLYGD